MHADRQRHNAQSGGQRRRLYHPRRLLSQRAQPPSAQSPLPEIRRRMQALHGQPLHPAQVSPRRWLHVLVPQCRVRLQAFLSLVRSMLGLHFV